MTGKEETGSLAAEVDSDDGWDEPVDWLTGGLVDGSMKPAHTARVVRSRGVTTIPARRGRVEHGPSHGPPRTIVPSLRILPSGPGNITASNRILRAIGPAPIHNITPTIYCCKHPYQRSR